VRATRSKLTNKLKLQHRALLRPIWSEQKQDEDASPATRVCWRGFSFVLGRRLLQEKDLAQPLNLFDPKSGLSYFPAVTALAKVYRQGVTTNNFNPASLPANVQQYWTDMMQPLQPGGANPIGSGWASTLSRPAAGQLERNDPAFNLGSFWNS